MLTLALAALVLVADDPAPRFRYSMDAGWRFAPGDHPAASRPGFDDRRWQALDVPHDWSVNGTPREDAPGGGRVGFLPTGIGWYRKAFRVPAEAKGKRVTVEFDGVHMNSEVWINGTRLGLRPYGYIGFEYDLTPHLRGGINVLAVRVDNSRQPNSRWYTGSGIYRHVWLNVSDQVHIPRDGVFVTTPVATAERTEVSVRTEVAGAGNAVVRSTIVDAAGTEVHHHETPVTLTAGAVTAVEQVLPVRLELWSVEHPNLYRLRSEIVVGGKTRDVRTTTFGARTAIFDKDRGFLLNGKQVKLRGANLHHEAGGFGAAVPEQVWESRLRNLKAMGINAIRTAHNPAAPEFMALCDQLGLLVMDEVFDEWTFGKVSEGYNKYFAEWSERDVTDFIRRDRNHPSVVLWSAGNEIGEQSAPDGVKVLERLMAIIRRHDSTRPITTGNDQIVADGTPARVEFLNALDLVGYNYVDRWHERRELFAEQDRLDHPDWKLIGTESGSIFQSFDEQYSLGDDPARPRPNYDATMFQVERLWKWATLRDWFSGSFMWTGHDYLGEATWPFKGFPSGAIGITGEPKDLFYLYQSLWTDTPGIRLFPHWNWPGREGQTIPVLAYTSCNIVELYLNGRLIGEQRKEFPAQGTAGGWNTYARPRIHPTTSDLHFRWDVPYQPGTLKATCRTREGQEAYSAEVKTAGPAVSVTATPERDTITTARGDLAIVRLSVVDAAGILVPTAAHEVCVTATNGRPVLVENANLQDLNPYRTDCGRFHGGRVVVYVRPQQPGEMTVTVTASGLPKARGSVIVRQGASIPSIPAGTR